MESSKHKEVPIVAIFLWMSELTLLSIGWWTVAGCPLRLRSYGGGSGCCATDGGAFSEMVSVPIISSPTIPGARFRDIRVSEVWSPYRVVQKPLPNYTNKTY